MTNPIMNAATAVNIDWNAKVQQMQHLKQVEYEREKAVKAKQARFAQAVSSPQVNMPYYDQRIEDYTKQTIGQAVQFVKDNPDADENPYKTAELNKILGRIKNNPIIEEAAQVKQDMLYVEDQFKKGLLSEDGYNYHIEDYEVKTGTPYEGDDPIEGDGRERFRFRPEPKVNLSETVSQFASNIGQYVDNYYEDGIEKTDKGVKEKYFKQSVQEIMTEHGHSIDYEWKLHQRMIREAKENGIKLNGIKKYKNKHDMVESMLRSRMNNQTLVNGLSPWLKNQYGSEAWSDFNTSILAPLKTYGEVNDERSIYFNPYWQGDGEKSTHVTKNILKNGDVTLVDQKTGDGKGVKLFDYEVDAEDDENKLKSYDKLTVKNIDDLATGSSIRIISGDKIKTYEESVPGQGKKNVTPYVTSKVELIVRGDVFENADAEQLEEYLKANGLYLKEKPGDVSFQDLMQRKKSTYWTFTGMLNFETDFDSAENYIQFSKQYSSNKNVGQLYQRGTLKKQREDAKTIPEKRGSKLGGYNFD